MGAGRKIEAVQLMQEYIKEYLGETFALSDLARASFYSPWYSHRLFVEMLHVTPADYVRKFRLSQSVLKLRDE